LSGATPRSQKEAVLRRAEVEIGVTYFAAAIEIPELKFGTHIIAEDERATKDRRRREMCGGFAWASEALLRFWDAKNKRAGVFAVQSYGFGGDTADGMSKMFGIVLCAV
jgi:hypothetical protein